MVKLLKNKTSLIVILGFIGFSTWWVILQAAYKNTTNDLLAFAGVYGVMALFGGILGLAASKKWGGSKSLVGRALLVIAFGLLAQEFGQLVYAYMTDIQHITIPYPSVGDIGYFGSTLLYIYGIFVISKAVGSKYSLKSGANKLLAFVVPAILLGTSYYLFLRGYQFDWHHPLTIFLDFGYPLGEATYISIAIMAFLLSRKYLGGIMKNRILLLLGAFVVQYAADFNFLYQNSHGTWVNGGYGDYLYFVSYTVMTASLIYFISAFKNLQNTSTAAVPTATDEAVQ
ncbi:MAG TPA: hypothetical protein VLG37_03645 [Candidatus Saccharimonadales bacterium]|nr:hypothetical protein [Candidatus Saccharimonadales bacterium]